jgi:predicted transcriptional regulator
VAHGYIVAQKVVDMLPVSIDKIVDNIAHVMLILTKKAMVTEKRSGGIATFIPNVGTR